MGKCYKCGKETDRLFWSNRDLARRFGEEDKYWCQECRDKADAFREWENEQSFTEEIVCPWSGLGYRVMHESDDCPISTGEDGYNLIYDSREEAESHWNRRANERDREEMLALAEEIDANGDALLADTSLLVGSVGLMRCYAERIRKALGVE